MKTKTLQFSFLGAIIFTLVFGVFTFLRANGDEITVCVRKAGSMRLLQEGQECRKNETMLSWNIQGSAGQQGPAGEPSWDEERIVELEARVTELEKLHSTPDDSTITLWENYNPTTDETVGDFLNVEGFSSAELSFNWQPGVLTHTCQYKYQYSSDGLSIDYDSTYLYFASASCVDSAMIPIPTGTKFLRINAWTPPSGMLNATLTLVP